MKVHESSIQPEQFAEEINLDTQNSAIFSHRTQLCVSLNTTYVLFVILKGYAIHATFQNDNWAMAHKLHMISYGTGVL